MGKKERSIQSADFLTKHGNQTSKYLFTEVKGKTDWHYNTKHAEKYNNLTDAERAWTLRAWILSFAS